MGELNFNTRKIRLFLEFKRIYIIQINEIVSIQMLLFKYWIYNLIRAVFFSKFERLFKKNMYNSIIQSTAHLKL